MALTSPLGLPLLSLYLFILCARVDTHVPQHVEVREHSEESALSSTLGPGIKLNLQEP